MHKHPDDPEVRVLWKGKRWGICELTIFTANNRLMFHIAEVIPTEKDPILELDGTIEAIDGKYPTVDKILADLEGFYLAAQEQFMLRECPVKH